MRRFRDIEFKKPQNDELKVRKIPKFFFISIAVLVVIAVNTVGIIFKSQKIESNIVHNDNIAFDHLLEAGKSLGALDITEAKLALSKLNNDIDKIDKELWFLTTEIEKQGIVHAGENLILAGQSFTNASEHFVDFANGIVVISSILMEEELDHESLYHGQDAFDVLKIASQDFNAALKDINLAKNYFEDIDVNTLPKKYRDKFKDVQNLVVAYGEQMEDVDEYHQDFKEWVIKSPLHFVIFKTIMKSGLLEVLLEVI